MTEDEMAGWHHELDMSLSRLQKMVKRLNNNKYMHSLSHQLECLIPWAKSLYKPYIVILFLIMLNAML